MNEYCKNCFELAEKLTKKKRECNTLKSQLDFAVRQKERFEQQCEALKSEGFTRESLITEQENEIDELRQECEELKTENEELNNRMAEVIYRATGGRLSYSNYTLDAIEQAFNDQLEILSDQKVEEETKELKQQLYLTQNEVHFKTEYIQEQRDIIKKLEQECEELKSYAQRQENQRETYYKEFLKKNRALEEIKTATKINCEEICGRKFEDCNDTSCFSVEILDIINKAKGEE